MSSEENKDILAGLIEDFFDIKAKCLKIEKPYSIAICKELIDQGEVSKLRETLKDVAASFEVADFRALRSKKEQALRKRIRADCIV